MEDNIVVIGVIPTCSSTPTEPFDIATFVIVQQAIAVQICNATPRDPPESYSIAA